MALLARWLSSGQTTGPFHFWASGPTLVLPWRQELDSRIFHRENLAGWFLYQSQSSLRHCPVWRLLCALCHGQTAPSRCLPSLAPPCLCEPLNCNGFYPHSVSTGAFACFPNQTLFPLFGEQGDPSLSHLSVHRTESSPKTNPIWP